MPGPPTPAARRPLRVAFVFSQASSAAREAIAGAYEYIDRHSRWEVAHIESGPRAVVDLTNLAWLDGFIAAGYRNYETLTAAGSPSWKRVFFACEPEWGPNVVTADEAAMARMAMDELLSIGLSRVGFCSLAPTQRGDAFKSEAARRGVEFHQFVRPVAVEEYWPRRHEYLGQWLASLPKPIGVFTQAHDVAQTVTASATLEGIHVPEQVAVLTCEASDESCSLSRPTLSCVTGGQRKIGFEAARMLDRLFQGKPAGGPILIPPTQVDRRGSTDILAVADADLANAIRLLRSHATEEESIDDVLRHVPLSRSQLERGMRRVLHRSPHEEVMRVRIETACRLLTQTSLSMAEVAVHSGLGTVSNFCKVFKRRIGKSPRQYRISEDVSH
jgi:LacI family transcriptional regulator